MPYNIHHLTHVDTDFNWKVLSFFFFFSLSFFSFSPFFLLFSSYPPKFILREEKMFLKCKKNWERVLLRLCIKVFIMKVDLLWRLKILKISMTTKS